MKHVHKVNIPIWNERGRKKRCHIRVSTYNNNHNQAEWYVAAAADDDDVDQVSLV